MVLFFFMLLCLCIMLIKKFGSSKRFRKKTEQSVDLNYEYFLIILPITLKTVFDTCLKIAICALLGISKASGNIFFYLKKTQVEYLNSRLHNGWCYLKLYVLLYLSIMFFKNFNSSKRFRKTTEQFLCRKYEYFLLILLITLKIVLDTWLKITICTLLGISKESGTSRNRNRLV